MSKGVDRTWYNIAPCIISSEYDDVVAYFFNYCKL